METPHISTPPECTGQISPEHMRLRCGVIQLVQERTGCTLGEAAKCLGESEETIIDWRARVQERNDPAPGLAELNNYCLFSLSVPERRAVMTRLSAAQRPQQPHERSQSSRRPPTLPEEQRLICAMSQYLREQMGLLQKDAAAAFDIAPSVLSLWSKRVEESGGQTIAPEEAFSLLLKRLGLDGLADLAENSPRVARMRGEVRQKPLPPRNEYIQADWRRVCAMIELLRTQFLFTVPQSANILHVNLPSYYAWLRKLGKNGGHGIAPEEAYGLLTKRLGEAKILDLAAHCPCVQRKKPTARPEAEECELYDMEDAEWQIFLAIELLLQVPTVDQVIACAAMQVSEATYEQYRKRFGGRQQTTRERRRAATLIVDLFDGELPKTQEEIGRCLRERYGQKPGTFFNNVLEAIELGDGKSFEGRASDDYVPTDAMPGCREKHQVILDRIRRGDPSGFHMADRCAYLDMKRADFFRWAIQEGMRKPPEEQKGENC